MDHVTIKKMTCARIPTAEGEFQLCLYHNTYDDKEHLALIMGDVQGSQDVLVRVHSECFTGDVLGSLRCDCGPQLNQALHLIAQAGAGVIIYLRQEGRGIGLLDKLRAYNLQDNGYDTVDANLMLGHQADARDYTVAALILQDLGVLSLRLLTNNPFKLASLERLGVRVTGRVPVQAPVHQQNAAYLKTKVERMRHLLNLDSLFDSANNQLEVDRLIQELIPPAPPRGRPFVTLTYAQSLDGSIAARRGESLAISSPQSLILTHHLRASHDAILVGIGTVLADNPQLTVRLVEGHNPQPVIVDSHLRFPLNARLLQTPATPPWIATTTAAALPQLQALETAGARILRGPPTPTGRVNLGALLAQLAEMGVNSLMVEGGASIITSFLAAGLVDRLVLTIAPFLVGGLNAVGNLSQLNGKGFPHLRHPRYQVSGPDIIMFGDVVWGNR